MKAVSLRTLYLSTCNLFACARSKERGGTNTVSHLLHFGLDHVELPTGFEQARAAAAMMKEREGSSVVVNGGKSTGKEDMHFLVVRLSS